MLLVAGLIAGCGGASSNDSSTAANAADRAFVAEMIPHHKLAVQMARSAQTQGTHPETKTLANNIVATQNREISLMSGVASQINAKIDTQAESGSGAGTLMSANAQALGMPMDQMGMSMNMHNLDGAKPFDRAFIDMMTPHHKGAIAMAQAELAKGTNPKLKTLAQTIIGGQSKEVSEMRSWRAKWFGGPAPPGTHKGTSSMNGMQH
ncbi:MAG: DUF305 domain-containing protein [Solirubrobacteraceae bacterium]